MKLVSRHHPTILSPSITDVAKAVDVVEDSKLSDPNSSGCFVLIEDAETTGAFMQAVCVDAHPHWQVEVSNSDEASLRALRAPVTRGKAIELLCRFAQGDRTMGNGAEWIDVDRATETRRAMSTALVVSLLSAAAAVALWFTSR